MRHTLIKALWDEPLDAQDLRRSVANKSAIHGTPESDLQNALDRLIADGLVEMRSGFYCLTIKARDLPA
ncbi:MAG: hypothetical protein PHC61_16255 [Chitinivibrionales bacterium]|nr:hypothetical protein [Chitinivibrionales bacterium]